LRPDKVKVKWKAGFLFGYVGDVFFRRSNPVIDFRGAMLKYFLTDSDSQPTPIGPWDFVPKDWFGLREQVD
jgi:hypothetical protein